MSVSLALMMSAGSRRRRLSPADDATPESTNHEETADKNNNTTTYRFNDVIITNSDSLTLRGVVACFFLTCFDIKYFVRSFVFVKFDNSLLSPLFLCPLRFEKGFFLFQTLQGHFNVDFGFLLREILSCWIQYLVNI